jgi:ribosomal protein S18 acetylase RimI-like enzyme
LLGTVPPALLFLQRPIRTDELYVAALAVVPDWRGRGVGRRMMRHAEDLAAAMELGALSLHVASTKALAQKLYWSLGYRVERALRPPLRHRLGIDHYLLMRKELDASAA